MKEGVTHRKLVIEIYTLSEVSGKFKEQGVL